MKTVTKGLMPEFAPVERETVQHRVYDDLRKRLMLGELKPGQPLKINTLAAAFGTSAQPVRESIRQLVAERALDATANRSARVPALNVGQMEDLRRTRLAVEGLATEMATERASTEEIDSLDQIARQGMAADNVNDILLSVELNLQFHMSLYGMSRSTELPPIIEGLWLRLGPLIRRAAETFDAADGRGVEMHFDAIKAMRDRDAVSARKAVEADINRFFQIIREGDLI